MNRVAVVSAVRTPIGRAGGAYADVHAADLLGVSFEAAVNRSGVDPSRVEQALAGCTQQSGDQALNIARNGWLTAGLPFSTGCTTIDTQCGSSQQAVNLAMALIASGQANIIMAGGVESLTRAPMFSAADAGSGQPYSDKLMEVCDMPHQGVAGERQVKKYGITREASDEYGLQSHLRAHAAWQAGHMQDEIAFVERDGKILLETDEGIRPDSNIEKISTLKPAYTDDGIINAASASQLSDGSSALLLASEKMVDELGLEPLAWIRRGITVGADPHYMLEGPIWATQQLLEREGLKLDDIDLFEIHEAFASVVLSWRTVHSVPDEKLNIDGGAISMGHPFGASGGRQLAHLIHRLRATGGKLGLQAMCCGGGIGTGTIVEVV